MGPLWRGLLLLPVSLHAYDVLMVIGGRYYDHARQTYIELSKVEVVGPEHVCTLPDLPESRHGHSAVRLGNSVVVCGGLSGHHVLERRSCFTLTPGDRGWRRVEAAAPVGRAFGAMGSSGQCAYLAGGRVRRGPGPGLGDRDRAWQHQATVHEYCPSRPPRLAWRSIANLSRPVADGCAAVTSSGVLWVVGGEAGVSVLEPRSSAWEEGVMEASEESGPVSTLEAGLASLQGGAPQPWWEVEEEPVPRVEAWTRPSRTGLRRRRSAQGIYQYGPPDRGGSRADNFGQGWGHDTGLGPVEGRRVEVPGYPGEGGRVEQAIRGGRITYPVLPPAEVQEEQGAFPGYPVDPLAGLAMDRGGSARDGYGWWTTARPVRGGWQGITRPPYLGEDGLAPPPRAPAPPKAPARQRPTAPPRPEQPVGQGCLATSLGGEEGVFVAGGFMGGGRRVRWLPVSRPGRALAEELAVLGEPRRWGPAVGSVGDSLAVAGGGDWGTTSVELFSRTERRWRAGPALGVAREYAAGVTVDSSWFPHCNFTRGA